MTYPLDTRGAPAIDGVALRRALLGWYDRCRRDIPWRARPGERTDPYRVWLSEIMCQQTTVAAVIPYFEAFTRRWPTVEMLAAADLDEILHAWQGLGYYARARNLHACARAVAREHGARFPDTAEGLRALPGVGAYTAAAVAAMAFGRAELPIDGNVTRVIARLFAITEPLPAGRSRITAAAAGLASSERPGDLAQAFMDLGAGVCVPRKPRCADCPVSGFCRASALGIAPELPVKSAKARRPTRQGIVFWTERADGAVLLRRRPESGLLGGLMEVPSTPWREEAWTACEAEAHAPASCAWRPVAGRVVHGFTHFHLELDVWRGCVPVGCNAPGTWALPGGWASHALPTVMRKVVKLASSSG